MKYKLKRVESDFKPFSLTIIFETREEYIHFHDMVMNKITRVPLHEMHGDVYRMGRGEIDSAEGEV